MSNTYRARFLKKKKKKKKRFEPRCRSKDCWITCISLSSENNNWMGKQCKQTNVLCASRLQVVCTVCYFCSSLPQVQLLYSNECLTMQIAWTPENYDKIRVTQAIKVLSSDLHSLGSHYNESSFNLHLICRV